MTDRRQHVLFLIPTLTGGGAERVVVTLIRHLNRLRFRLALAVVDTRDAAFLDDVPQDVEFVDLRCARVRYALPRIARLIWNMRPDVVFSTLGHLNLALAMMRAILPGDVRYVARETTLVTEGLRAYRTASWWRWAYRRYYSRFDRVVCQSRSMRDDLIVNFALPHGKAVVVHNPIDIRRVDRLAAEPIANGHHRSENESAIIHLVAAGRFKLEKGFDLLISALALCRDPRLQLTIMGDGPLRATLERLAHEKGVADQVRIVGFQRNPFPFFAHADAFVLSSRYEGFPNVVLEALACGTPVIATPAAGGVREILDGVHGCLIAESISPEALAAALGSWVEGARPRIDREVVRPYQLERIVAQYEKVLAE